MKLILPLSLLLMMSNVNALPVADEAPSDDSAELIGLQVQKKSGARSRKIDPKKESSYYLLYPGASSPVYIKDDEGKLKELYH